MSFRMEQSVDGAILLFGELNSLNHVQFSEDLEKLSLPQDLVIDFGQLNHVTGHSLNALLVFAWKFTGRRVRFINVSPEIAKGLRDRHSSQYGVEVDENKKTA